MKFPINKKTDSRIGRETLGSGPRSGATRELPSFGANPWPRGLSEKKNNAQVPIRNGCYHVTHSSADVAHGASMCHIENLETEHTS